MPDALPLTQPRAMRTVIAALLALCAVLYVPGLFWTFSEGGQDIVFYLGNALIFGVPVAAFAVSAWLLAGRNGRRAPWLVLLIAALGLIAIVGLGSLTQGEGQGVRPDWSEAPFIAGSVLLAVVAVWNLIRGPAPPDA